MNKSELIDVAAAAGDISKAAAAKTLDAFLSTIVTAVSKGDSVTLIGFDQEQVRLYSGPASGFGDAPPWGPEPPDAWQASAGQAARPWRKSGDWKDWKGKGGRWRREDQRPPQPPLPRTPLAGRSDQTLGPIAESAIEVILRKPPQAHGA